MKVIVCGAGQVGTSIAAYLSEEDNDVTIIDTSESLISEINETLDVSGIVGFASHPDVLERAGAHEADLIIAATHIDEVNMIACQVAHSLFNVPKKIARVREQVYLKPVWANLFSRDHMPIDAIISPEVEVARAISNRLKVPGTFNVIPMVENTIQLASVICHDDCPLIGVSIKHLDTLFPDLPFNIMTIVRGDEKIIPDKGLETIEIGDEVYFLTPSEHLQRVMSAFGHEEEEARHILIAGGGNIGFLLAKIIEKHHKGMIVNMIESNRERAKLISRQLKRTNVLHGDSLDRKLLEEAHIDRCEAVIALTNHDETNVLISLLAKEYGSERSIALINNQAYMPLVSSLGVNAIVSPRSITVSIILGHIRKGRIKSAHSLRDGFAEIIELEALDTAAAVHVPIKEMKLSKDVRIGLIIREKEIIVPRASTVIKPGDTVIVLAAHDQVKTVERMFSVHPEYF